MLKRGISDADFNIVFYVDSTGCNTCAMKLRQWKELMEDFHQKADIDISLALIVHPKEGQDVAAMMRKADFNYPVFTDIDGSFGKENGMPQNPRNGVFLIDEDNKVIAIGNPVFNPAVKRLFMAYMAGNDCDMATRLTDTIPPVTARPNFIQGGIIRTGEKAKFACALNNSSE